MDLASFEDSQSGLRSRTIIGCSLAFRVGENAFATFLGPRSIATEFRVERMHGLLGSSHVLVWDDGDNWDRSGPTPAKAVRKELLLPLRPASAVEPRKSSRKHR